MHDSRLATARRAGLRTSVSVGSPALRAIFRRGALSCLSVIASCVCAGAAPPVRLPTDGYVRSGRYFPVEVQGSGPVTLRADGCLPCEVANVGRTTVPMLVVTTPGELHGGGPALPLRVPADDERLVGATAEPPADLFPGRRVIPVRLDPADPLPGPPAAWEVLDAVVLDAAAMAALDDAHRSALLAGGVMLAVVGDAVAPDDRWPWQRRGTAWVLSYAPAGPAGVVEPDAYVPTESWSPGWPPAIREAVVVIAVLLSLATVAWLYATGPAAGGRGRPSPVAAEAAAPVSAARPWAGVLGAVTLSLAAAGGVAVWRATLDPVARGGGDVTVAGGRWSQRDAWVYNRARSSTDVSVPWAGWTHPIFASTAAAEGARVTVAPDGRLGFALHLSSGAATAFVRRDVAPGSPPDITGGSGGAMRGLAPLYLSTGDRVAGETAAAAGRWPGVAIRRP